MSLVVARGMTPEPRVGYADNGVRKDNGGRQA